MGGWGGPWDYMVWLHGGIIRTFCFIVAAPPPAAAAAARVDGEGKKEEEEEEEPKAPVITDQPPGKIVAVVGEDLTLPLKVKGEKPLRY